APGDRVLVDVGLNGGGGGVLDRGWSGKIGEALREVDPVGRMVCQDQARHLANHRLGEAERPLRDQGTPRQSLARLLHYSTLPPSYAGTNGGIPPRRRQHAILA